MAETVDKNQQPGASKAAGSDLNLADDDRLRYMGFDVGPSKIGKLFRTEKEEQQYLEHVREKREHNDALRDTSNFREERVSGVERYALIAASIVVLISFFLPITPWISGYFETRTEITIGASKEPSVAGDSSATAATAATETPAPPAAKVGFQELQVKRTRTRIEKTPFKLSGAQSVARIGAMASDVFSSGIALKLTGILFVVFVLLMFAVPLFIIYSVLTIKGDADTVALELKKTLRFGWYPILLWFVMLVLSVVGADYGFDTTGALKQVGASYGLSSFLGLLGSGIYISLAGCLFAGAKSVEI